MADLASCPKHVDRAGVWIEPVATQCSHCSAQVEVETSLYVNTDYWPGFEDLVLDDAFGTTICSACDAKVVLLSPLLLDCAHRDVLIFVAHGGDRETVVDEFEAHLSSASVYIAPPLAAAAQGRPFTFVHGWLGLRMLIRCFRDMARPVITELGALRDTYGYKYGSVFFAWPEQALFGRIVEGFILAAENHRLHCEIELAYSVLQEAVTTIGQSSQRLMQELGTTALLLHKYEEGAAWLEKAVRLRHSWLAPTASFYDPTPPARQEESSVPSSV